MKTLTTPRHIASCGIIGAVSGKRVGTTRTFDYHQTSRILSEPWFRFRSTQTEAIFNRCNNCKRLSACGGFSKGEKSAIIYHCKETD